MDLAFQQTKYRGLLFLHIGNTVIKFLPRPSIIEVYFTCFNERLPNYLIYHISKCNNGNPQYFVCRKATLMPSKSMV